MTNCTLNEARCLEWLLGFKFTHPPIKMLRRQSVPFSTPGSAWFPLPKSNFTRDRSEQIWSIAAIHGLKMLNIHWKALTEFKIVYTLLWAIMFYSATSFHAPETSEASLNSLKCLTVSFRESLLLRWCLPCYNNLNIFKSRIILGIFKIFSYFLLLRPYNILTK